MKPEKTKTYGMDMTSGPVLKKMLLFALPLMGSGILQLLFNAADIIVVGRFAGDNSLAAVGSTSSLINLLVNLFVGLSVGANVVAARNFGAKKPEEIRATVHTATALGIYSGIFLTVAGLTGARAILTWMRTPPEVLGLAALYLRIYFLGMPATMVYNFGSAILRAAGDTKRPLYYLFLAGVINVILNLVFVIFFRMDVAGVAAATAISQFAAAFCVVRCLRKEKPPMRLEVRKIAVHSGKLAGILRIGLPAGLQGILFSFSNVVIQSSVNSFGPVIVAGNSAAMNIEGFVYLAMNAFYQAAISFVSQNYGAGNFPRIRRITITGQFCVTVTGLALSSLVLLAPEILLQLYTSSPEVIRAGVTRLSYVVRTYILCGMMDVMVGALRGTGYSVLPMLVTLIGVCGLRLLWIATVFRIPQFHTIETIYVSYPISWLLTFCCHLISFLVIFRRDSRRMQLPQPGSTETPDT